MAWSGFCASLLALALIDWDTTLLPDDITLPLLRPYITLVAVISAIAATKVFEEVYLMTQGGPADSTRTLVYYVYDQAFAELEISYACTIGLALFLIVLLLSLVRFLFAADKGLA